MLHRNSIENYSGSLSGLADDVGNLKYDALAEFLRLLAAKIERDGSKDAARGRVRLSSALQNCAAQIAVSATEANEAWRIAKPFMPKDERSSRSARG